MVGDSFLARLDKDRLGKNNETIINLAKGGNKFRDVIQSLRTFKSNSENDKYLIKQIFISVGTNDIRNCQNGIIHLKGELFNLVRTIKHFFPTAKLYMQSLLPLPVTHDHRSHVVENVLNFNKMIYHVCVHDRVYMIDIFRTFMFRGYRHHMLFPNIQSLNNYYQNLKFNISDFCRDRNAKIVWLHWRSASSGLCVKFDDGTYISKIHSMANFTKQFINTDL